MSSLLLSVESLHASYGKVRALGGVSITVRQGEVVAILGANGAGKSTLLNCITGIVPVAAGQIHFDSKSILGLKPWQLSRMGIVQVPEGREIFPNMTVEENLKVIDAFGDGPVFTIEKVLDLFPRLEERIYSQAGHLSGGEQQMLAIGRGLMARPRLALFDEPSLGLSPALSKLVLSSISKLKQMGVSSLLVEQNMRAALKIADRAYVMRVGRIVAEAPSGSSGASNDIFDAYLGAA